MLSALRHWLRQRRLARHAPDPALFRSVVAAFPMLARLDADSSERLWRRAGEILADKDFHAAGDSAMTAEARLAVAALAALPVLELGTAWYRGFHTFIVYPGSFVAEFEETDADGVVHRGRDVRAGEAWAHGPVVLALEEVLASGQGEGFNVVVHELAHQIDQLNGDMDGFPPLHRGMDPARWSEVFSAAFERLNQQLDAGLEPPIDPYAAESPAEFFAVACEYFFDAPDWLLQHEPAVCEQLTRFFRPATGR